MRFRISIELEIRRSEPDPGQLARVGDQQTETYTARELQALRDGSVTTPLCSVAT